MGVLVASTPASSMQPISHPISQHIVDTVRKSNATWEPVDAWLNPLKKLTAVETIGLAGTIHEKRINPPSTESLKNAFAASIVDFPREYDARVSHAQCKHAIRNQLKCGSCWAFSVAETWSDNACILGLPGVTNATVFSTEDILACASFGSGKCGGGRINYAFDYVVSDGLVTEKCMPYTSGNGSVDACPAEVGPDKRTCPIAGASWDATACTGQPNDLFTPELMKQGIMELGAVATGYTVYADFYNYKSGIYKHVTGKMLGGHAIKVVGWGVKNATATTNATNYWIVANSWGSKWGEDGYFRFDMSDTACHFGMGGSYNCGKTTTSTTTELMQQSKEAGTVRRLQN